MHGGVEAHRLIGLPNECVLTFEDLNQSWREFVLVVVFLLVCELADLQEQSVVVYLLKLVLVFFDRAADQPVLLKLL